LNKLLKESHQKTGKSLEGSQRFKVKLTIAKLKNLSINSSDPLKWRILTILSSFLEEASPDLEMSGCTLPTLK
jgi:hypothetical protein